jgi:sucrose-6-phosphate hydrolase SacC (GH32 family)
VTSAGPLTHIEVLVDRTSIEVFGNHGEISLTRCILPSRDGISVDCRGGPATFGPLKI